MAAEGKRGRELWTVYLVGSTRLIDVELVDRVVGFNQDRLTAGRGAFQHEPELAVRIDLDRLGLRSHAEPPSVGLLSQRRDER